MWATLLSSSSPVNEILNYLTRCWIAGAGDADPVIGEGGVHAGKFNAGHVTGHTLLRTHGTGVGVATCGFAVAGFS